MTIKITQWKISSFFSGYYTLYKFNNETNKNQNDASNKKISVKSLEDLSSPPRCFVQLYLM